MVERSAAKQKAEIGVKILAEKKTPAYQLRLQMSESQLNLLASLSVFDAENTIAPSELIELLATHNVKDCLDLEEVANFCSKAAMGIDQEDVLLGRGKEPTKGRDGWLELTVSTGSDEVEFDEDERGNVDLRNLQTFTNVDADQELGIVHPPETGDPGIAVNGLPIPPLTGKPLELITGDGTCLSEDGTHVIATNAGRVVFDGKKISIAEEFVVTGDVDYSVGNIDFNGFVEIKGDVLDDFNIRASKGIRITGAVGACRLEAGGPVEIGSMAGLGTGLIRCQGDLKANYLNQVEVECWGQVLVNHEIRNCSIKSTRAIVVERGTISGGESIALDGIEARNLGATSGIKTRLTAGVYFPETDRLTTLRQKQRSYNLQIQRITAALGPLSNRKNLRKALQEAIDLRISLLTQRKSNLEQEKDLVEQELESFKAEEHPSANPKINFLSRVHEGVVFCLGETVEEIQNERTGPLTVIENSTTGGLRFLNHSPLKILAAEIEEKAIAADEAAQLEEQDSAAG